MESGVGLPSCADIRHESDRVTAGLRRDVIHADFDWKNRSVLPHSRQRRVAAQHLRFQSGNVCGPV
jgi:hypothetical protein